MTTPPPPPPAGPPSSDDFGGFGPSPDQLGLPAQPGYDRTGRSHGGPSDVPGQGWHQLPPEVLASLHRPGIVPLRPLQLADIFSGSLQTMRRNPAATIGMALVVLAVFMVPSLLGSLGLTRMADLTTDDTVALTLLVNLVFSSLASIALTGMIIYVVSEAVLGDRVDLARTWAAVRGRLPALVGSVLLVSILFIAALVAFFVLTAVLVMAAAALDSPGPAIALTVLAMLGMGVLLAWAGCRVGLAPAAVVLEKAGPWRGISRAWTLTKGKQGWRVVGITILAGILAGLFSSLIQLPVAGVVTVALEGAVGPLSPLHPALLVTDHLVQLVVQAFTIPFTAGVSALLYLDQRIRREGLDITLTHAAQSRAAARQR